MVPVTVAVSVTVAVAVGTAVGVISVAEGASVADAGEAGVGGWDVAVAAATVSVTAALGVAGVVPVVTQATRIHEDRARQASRLVQKEETGFRNRSFKVILSTFADRQPQFEAGVVFEETAGLNLLTAGRGTSFKA